MTSFSPQDRARIGKYASENGNAAAVKKFKATHEIGETQSTVRLFNMIIRTYSEEVAHASLYVMLVASKLTFHRKYGRSSIRLLVLLGDFKPLWTARTDRESSKP